jgi:hypothetical protein
MGGGFVIDFRIAIYYVNEKNYDDGDDGDDDGGGEISL